LKTHNKGEQETVVELLCWLFLFHYSFYLTTNNCWIHPRTQPKRSQRKQLIGRPG